MSFGSHLPMLMKCFEFSDGPILEMGIGEFSTPILNMLCAMRQKRHILSLENDREWFEEYRKKYESDFHKFRFVENWADEDIESIFWSVALIDHRPKNRRRKDILRLKERAYLLVLHDSQPDSEQRHYKYDEIYPHFKYRYDFKDCLPHTTVVSNYSDLKEIRWGR